MSEERTRRLAENIVFQMETAVTEKPRDEQRSSSPVEYERGTRREVARKRQRKRSDRPKGHQRINVDGRDGARARARTDWRSSAPCGENLGVVRRGPSPRTPPNFHHTAYDQREPERLRQNIVVKSTDLRIRALQEPKVNDYFPLLIITMLKKYE